VANAGSSGAAPSAGFDVGRTAAGGVVAKPTALPQPGMVAVPNPARAGAATLTLWLPDNGPVRLDAIDAAGRIILAGVWLQNRRQESP